MNDDEPVSDRPVHHHDFAPRTFKKPTSCNYCSDILWGIINQGLVCRECRYIAHERCSRLPLLPPCRQLVLDSVAVPRPHQWIISRLARRRFCHVCHRKGSRQGYACQACDLVCHQGCQSRAINNCRRCGTTFAPINADAPSQHHWTLICLASAKCCVCKKTTLNNDPYNVFMCQWCRRIVHWMCHGQLPETCDSGPLASILLPSTAVLLHANMDALQLEHYLSRHVVTAASSTPIEEAIAADDDSESSGIFDKSTAPATGTGGCPSGSVMYQLYDGDTALCNHQSVDVLLQTSAVVRDVVTTAARLLHITADSKTLHHFYYLAEVCPDSENVLQTSHTLGEQASHSQLVLRHERVNDGYIKIYLPTQERVCARQIFYNQTHTITQVIEQALKKFDRLEGTAADYEVVCSRVAGPFHNTKVPEIANIAAWLHELRQKSVSDYTNSRLYLIPRVTNQEPIALFVSGLPRAQAQKQYEQKLSSVLQGALWSELDTIFYEYGSLVLLYHSTTNVRSAVKALTAAGYGALLLPRIDPEALANQCPLLVFVNPKSGGCQGAKMIESFRRILNPFQVFDLDLGGPLPGFYVFRHVKSFRILACGGDGTVGWVLSCLDNIGQMMVSSYREDAVCPSPSIAIFPVGTGNDLSRVLHWGPGLGNEDLADLLVHVIESEEVKLDRWAVTLLPIKPNNEAVPSMFSARTTDDNATVLVMNNYMGIGLEADLSLDFHNARQESPEKFNSRWHNKTVYVKKSLTKWLQSHGCKELQRHIRLIVDGQDVELPSLEGIIISNISSWGSGCDIWGVDTPDDKFTRPAHYDGKLEVVGFSGLVHLGQIQSAVRSGFRLAQGEHIIVQLLFDMPVHVDGEPWLQPAGHINIRRSALRATMLQKVKTSRVKRRNTEPTQLQFESDETESPESSGTSSSHTK